MKIHNTLWIATILTYKILAVFGGDLPPEIQKCKSTDNEKCIAKTIEEIVKRYPNGNPAFGMPNIAVINQTDINISKTNPNSPIQINFKFIKCTIYGLEKTNVLRASGFDKELKKVVLELHVPNLRLIGDYESTGKILLLPLNGNGKGNIELRDCNIRCRVKVEFEKRNGKNYANIKNIKALIEPKQMLVKLENVIRDNPILSETVNSVINENWKDVWTELQDGINRAMEIIMINIMRDTLNELSTDDFYAD